MLRFWVRLRNFAFIGATLCTLFPRADAQIITKIGALPRNSDLRCAFFWDTAHGVVGGVQCLYTYNSGVWTQAKYPEVPDTIKSLRFLDGIHLFAAGGTTSIWESSDEGATWEMTLNNLVNADDIYMDASHVLEGVNSQWIGMMRGTTVAHTDSLNYALVQDDAIGYYSSNGGRSWAQNGDPAPAGYSLVADSCHGVYYTLSDGPKIILSRSKDGRLWSEVRDFGVDARDIMDGGDDGDLSIEGDSGIWRTFNGGLTCSFYPGPVGTKDDRRIFAFGPFYRFLITMDDTGAVWCWDYGSTYGPNNFLSTATTQSVTFQNPCVANVSLAIPSPCSVRGITLTSAQVSGALHLDSIRTGFDTLAMSDTLWFHDSLATLGAQQFYVHLRGFYGETDTLPFDTTITISIDNPMLPIVGSDTMNVPYLCDSKVPVVFQTLCPNEMLSLDTAYIIPPTPNIFLDTTATHLRQPGSNDTLWFDCSNGTVGIQRYSLSIKATLGGDTGSSTIPIYINTFVARPVVQPIPVIQTLAACSEMHIPVVVEQACLSRIDSVHFLDSTNLALLSSGTMFPISPAQTDTIWLTTTFRRPGKYSTSIRIFTWTPGRKTDSVTTTITIQVNQNSTVPVLTSVPLPTLSNCRSAIVPILLHSLPCDSLSLTTFSISVTSGLTYLATPAPLGTLAADKLDTIFITIPPQNLNGYYTIAARAAGAYLGIATSFDTTLVIRLHFSSATSLLVPTTDSLTLGTITTCQSDDTALTFQNPGCDTLTVTGDATQWPSGWSVSDPTFPFPLAPDSIFIVTIHFTPAITGTTYPVMLYTYEDKSGKSRMTNVALSAQATPAPLSLLIADTALNFGTFSRCNASDDTTVSITNSSCDSVLLSRTMTNTGSGFLLTSGGDTILAPMQSAEYEIHFSDSMTGVFSSALHIDATGARGSKAIDTLIHLSATIVAGSHLAALSTQGMDFGTTSICEERDSSITITNTGCESDTIALSFANTSFASSLPQVIVRPGQEATIPVTTVLDTSGHTTTNRDTVHFTGNLDFPLPPVVLSRAIVYPRSFGLSIAGKTNAPSGATVPMYVLRTGTIPHAVDEIDYDLLYDDNLLSYVPSGPSDIKMIGSSILPNGLTDRSFAMRPATDRDTIAALEFQSFVSRNERTPITLTSEQFSAGGVISPPCIASIDSTGPGMTFSLQLACGDSTIMTSLQNLPLRIVSMGLDQNTLRFTVECSDPRYTSCNAEILDVLGTQRIVSDLTVLPLTSTSLDLDVLPAGVYFLRLRCGGIVTTKPFAIVR